MTHVISITEPPNDVRSLVCPRLAFGIAWRQFPEWVAVRPFSSSCREPLRRNLSVACSRKSSQSLSSVLKLMQAAPVSKQYA